MSLLIKDLNNIWLLEFIHKISNRPGMYLGSESVTDLAIYLSGYFRAMADVGSELVIDERILFGFNCWLAINFNRDHARSSLNWSGRIHNLIDGSDESIYTFFRLFDQYIGQVTYDGIQAICTDFNLLQHNG